MKDKSGNKIVFDRAKLLAQKERIEKMSPDELLELQVNWIETFYTVNGKPFIVSSLNKEYLKKIILEEREKSAKKPTKHTQYPFLNKEDL